MKFSIAVLTAIAAALVASAPVASKEAEVPALPVDNVLERVVEAFFNGPSIDAEIKDKTAADVKGVGLLTVTMSLKREMPMLKPKPNHTGPLTVTMSLKSRKETF